MKPTTILYLALAPLGLAASIADAANPMAMVGFTKRDHKKHDHKGRVADFREACNCPPVNCPSFLSKAEVCLPFNVPNKEMN